MEKTIGKRVNSRNKVVARALVKNSDAATLMNKVRAEISGMNEYLNIPNRTNGSFKYAPNSTNLINIHTQTSLAELLNVNAFLWGKERDYVQASSALGLTKFPVFTWCGYDLKSWQHDLKKRIAMIENESRYTELRKIEAELTTLLSQDDKLAILTEKLSKL